LNSPTTSLARSALVPGASARAGNDPIFALHDEATRREQEGESILNLTLGALLTDDRRLAVMATASQAFVDVAVEKAAAYAPIAGDSAFLDAVVADLFGTSPLSKQATAVATAGATGALHHAIANFVEPGQAVLTTEYYWGPYHAIAEHGHKRIETFSMFNGSGGFDVQAFEEGLRGHLEAQGRALALLNFPCHNPTGYSLDADEWEDVAGVVRSVAETGPVALLIDYAYGSYGSAEARGWIHHVPAMLESATVLVAWTASKTFTQYGARVGALVALHTSADERTAIRNALGYSCRGTWSNCNHRGLLGVAELLTNPELSARADAERQEFIGLLDQRVVAFNDCASKTAIRYPRYEGGFFVSVFTPDSEVTATRMRELGVYVLPMPGAVRVALCATPLDSVPRLVAALAEGVAAAASADSDRGTR